MVVPRSKYLIYSVEHRGWWMPNGWGYTESKAEAGRYEYDEAARIVQDANRYCDKDSPNEVLYIDK